VKRLLASALVLLLGRRRRRAQLAARERIVQPGFPNRRGELVVLVLLGCAAACGVAFPVVYAIDSIPNQTQFLGLALGLCFAFIAIACIVISKRLIVTEELEEDYPQSAHPEEATKVEQILDESGDRFTRRRLLVLAGGAAGTALGVALATPAVSLGPVLHMDAFFLTPWRRGVRLVDELGRVFRADDVEEGALYTAFPQHADREQMGAPLVVVRLKPEQLELPAERHDWAPEGIVAYSKICTHAGCAIALYRKPTFPVVEPRPALVCPCHFSTFDPARAAKVIFGPAGRPLPQLPLMIEGGELRAAGNFSGAVGPSWWGVRNRSTKP
jgi:ubiquinol-cytochrome c reductase iron-sulfur subunit